MARPTQVTEFRKPPKADRYIKGNLYVDEKGNRLYVMRVTETEDMRNAGSSVVNILWQDGWVIPEDAALRSESPDGLSFNMVKDYDTVMAERKRNSDLARRMEGFKPDAMPEIAEPLPKEDERAPLAGLGAQIAQETAGKSGIMSSNDG